MFRKMMMVAVLAGIPMFAIAQDPVTERPNSNPQQVQPKQAAPKQAPKAVQQAPKGIAISGSVWAGRETINQNGILGFELHRDGKAVMVDANSTVKGTWVNDGEDVVIRFKNCCYYGKLQGRVLSGHAVVTEGEQRGQKWNFRVEYADPYRNREYRGKENLGGFGPLAFRFGENNTVEMIDAQSTVKGTYTINVDEITITFGNCVYVGRYQTGNRIVGTARYTSGEGNPWSFEVAIPK